MSATQKIGLFFGSFNPIHMGHLIIANLMAETSDLKKVWFVVSPQNPLKPAKGLLHEFDRYDMVRAAIFDNYKLEASDVEFHLPKPSYTIHTLVHLKEKHPDKEFRIILGEDNLESFTRWKNYQQILDYYGLYVYPRPHTQLSELRTHPNVTMIDAPTLDISATFIRNCIRKKQSVRYLVPDAVEEMIRVKGFYQD
ncbi:MULTISPECIES: nicotinate (nicotinamide) nucleotide adenylyltransferase [Chryseolinea]|jgi:nicotinate-nucleotide adenylyltransferase|uniref:Probable nicotinate-nucleotide adenylyltransferase n=2 Tax=Chryseolinea TaxID=1433993 RepID=A0A1M5NXH3_9BACT|nr:MULTISPECIES: nicotinate (nicotinamide) nucleotide adenylyltransferase [Chryseolinea]AYB31031.1 nicotinate-nucleotide adenylyltransferase [Chryseolinea soli]SHG94221.1 nicotinate-nucleotide adenylyltransferase [Chryseolinea serpens]